MVKDGGLADLCRRCVIGYGMNRNAGVDKPSRFEEMTAWKKARELTRAVYAISAKSRLAKEFEIRDSKLVTRNS